MNYNIADTAFELKIAVLQAQRAGIIVYFAEEDIFQLKKESFKELFKGKEYIIKATSDKDMPYQYAGRTDHLNFMCATKDFLFNGDKERFNEPREGDND